MDFTALLFVLVTRLEPIDYMPLLQVKTNISLQSNNNTVQTEKYVDLVELFVSQQEATVCALNLASYQYRKRSACWSVLISGNSSN